MHLRRLILEEFRLYHRLELDLSPAGLALYGPNASGKSSLLEAIAMLATTRASRTNLDREVINWTSGQDFGFPPFARIRGTVEKTDAEVEIDIAFQLDATSNGPLQKAVRVNGRNVRTLDAIGTLKTVSFSPEDLALVAGPPSGRRRYLDMMISQLDGRYLRALARYNRILVQRNSLLKSLGKEGASANSASTSAQLSFWDDELVAFGSRLVARRLMATKRLSVHTTTRFESFSDARELSLFYRPSIDDQSVRASVERSPIDTVQAVFARAFSDRLQEVRADELRRGMSIVGPHRDDFSMEIDGVDVATFGSRGQQRLAVIALKLAESDLMLEESGERPVILLDDVLSELDPERQEALTSAVAVMNAQIIVTATDEQTVARTPLVSLPSADIASGGTIRHHESVQS
jgi:DNA replication and repair protein RecF